MQGKRDENDFRNEEEYRDLEIRRWTESLRKMLKFEERER